MTNPLCNPFGGLSTVFHRWDKWKDIEKGDVGRAGRSGERLTVGNYIIQERVCIFCGKKQLRRESTWIL